MSGTQNKTAQKIDNTIIEHLACLEINDLILQPPFHLVGDIQYNDKSLSFDGVIEVYNHENLKKETLVNTVPVQVKGTTRYKKMDKQNKIKHSVSRRDIDVFYKIGNGVLYLVVTINPNTLKKPAYYRILAPLDLKSLLKELDNNGNDTITLSFKKLNEGHLEFICNTLINLVYKQPTYFVETGEMESFQSYTLEFVDVQKENFNEFEESAYMYGVSPNGTESPLELVNIIQKEGINEDVISIGEETFPVNYKITERKDEMILTIEDTLSYEISKKESNATVSIGRLKTLSSYIKSLKILHYHLKYHALPLNYFTFDTKWGDIEAFNDISEVIANYEELITVCKQIGISENYVFHEEENLPDLFNNNQQEFPFKIFDLSI
ncbi:DUF4365 domain-containing protein [Guptibacillus spartinae]|uniref:DUF4365 domain-containing protein n=1 Tax=Guptibacillus spartinae TaxID=3025679 RepID=UPI0023629E48|nr:DUF4365 domain-containing protein [Pseudalkalibacillus spartinae]